MIYGRFGKNIIAGAGYNDIRFIDQPYWEDGYSFEQNLKKAIQQQISAASKCAQIDLSTIQEKLDTYTWTGIFKIDKELPPVSSRD